MSRYLQRRDGGIYYFRRPIPAKLRPYFAGDGHAGGEKQWMQSLHTTDPALARSLRDDEAARTSRLIHEATRKLAAGIPPAPTPAPRPVIPPEEAERRAKAWERYAQDEVEQAWRDGLTGANEEPDETDPVRRQIADAVEHTRLRIEEERRIAREERARERRASRLPITELFEAYVRERQPSPSTVQGFRSHLNSLIAHLGHDDAGRVTVADIIGWKDALVAEKVNGKPRAAKTINGSYLAAAATVFGWGLRNQRVPLNPAAGIKVSAPKRVRLRDSGFTEAEAIAILSAAMLPTSGNLSPEHALARRWVPWLCAYTGARVNEITQLRREDVKKLGDVWTIRITPEAGTTKNQAARVVPLHPHLIHQGFPAVAAGSREGPLFYDPARQRADKKDKRPFRKVGERLAEWVRDLGVDDPEVAPNHGWRHRFKTVARRVKMDPEAREAIAGHAPRTEGERYGSWEPEALASEIAKLPRFTLPAERGIPE